MLRFQILVKYFRWLLYKWSYNIATRLLTENRDPCILVLDGMELVYAFKLELVFFIFVSKMFPFDQ